MLQKHYCGRCRRKKLFREFYVYGGKPQAPCKTCRRKYYRKQYAADPKTFSEKTRSSRHRVAAFLKQYKLAHPICTDCKLLHPPWRLDFDHISGDKVSSIARAASSNWSPVRILKEIAKCEVVCANCHRDRTHSRRMLAAH